MSYTCGLHPNQRLTGSRCKRKDCLGCNPGGSQNIGQAEAKAAQAVNPTPQPLYGSQPINHTAIYDEIVEARNRRRDWVLDTVQKMLVSGELKFKPGCTLADVYDDTLAMLESSEVVTDVSNDSNDVF